MSNDNNVVEISIEQKTLGGEILFQNMNLTLKAGEIVSLLGPSGCGKTTLLRMIAGLESSGVGEISIAKNVIDYVGFIFQKPILYPHLNVAKNILLGNNEKLSKVFPQSSLRLCFISTVLGSTMPTEFLLNLFVI